MSHDNNFKPSHVSTHPPTVPGLDILGVIARGGQATVYQASDPQHGRLVALKVLHPTTANDTSSLEAFERERVGLGRLSDHPAIVSLFDSGYTTEGSPYLVLEHVPGGSLKDRLTSGPLGFDEASTMIVALAAALERAHHDGILHCDINPGNILRSAYDTWMLADFGIASGLDHVAPNAVVQATYAHAAPETFTQTPLSRVSDVYSLASVLASCLTGLEPFAMVQGEAATATMLRIMTQPYPRVEGAGIPYEVTALLAMSLSKEPSDRPVSARAFGVALNDIRQRSGLAPAALRTGNEASGDATSEMSCFDMNTAEVLVNADRSAASATTTHRRRRRVAGLVAIGVLALGAVGLDRLPQSEAQGLPEASATVNVVDLVPDSAALADDDGDPTNVVPIENDDENGVSHNRHGNRARN